MALTPGGASTSILTDLTGPPPTLNARTTIAGLARLTLVGAALTVSSPGPAAWVIATVTAAQVPAAAVWPMDIIGTVRIIAITATRSSDLTPEALAPPISAG